MQKDVLIEMIANAMSTIDLRTEPNDADNEDQQYLTHLRDNLYSTHQNDIDYQTVASTIIEIKDKYSHLPINQYYK